MAARFYRQNIAQYSPLSFEEMLFAPSMMRKRHDELDSSIAEVDTSLGQYSTMTQDQDFVKQAIDPVSTGLNSMAEQLAKQGYNSQSASEFRKLKSQKDQLWSPTGDVGIAQSRLASFQSKAKELKDQYKDNPEIANFYINKLAQSEGLSRDAQGKIVNQGLNQINNVRHYDAKQISEMINGQIDNIKDTLIKDYGFSKTGNISSIQDIYREGQLNGRTAEEINEILLAQMSPEVIRSAQQYGQVSLGSAEAGVKSLMQQVAGAAQGRASMNLNTNYSVITNEEGKMDLQAKKDNAYKGLYTDSDRLELPTANPFADLTFKDGKYVAKPVKSGTLIQGTDPLAPGNRNLSADNSIDYNAKAKEANRKFETLRKSIPALASMTPEKAHETINNYYTNIGQNYMGRANFDKNLEVINQTLKGNLTSSTFMTKNGEVLNFSELAELTGLTEEEVISKYKGTTSVELNPILGASAPITMVDKKGKTINLYQQLDKESIGIAADTQKVLQHLYGDAKSAEISSENLGNGTYLNTYVINDFVNEPIVITTTKNLMPKDLEEYTGKSASEIQAALPKSLVKGVKEIVGQTSKDIASNIQNGKY